MHDFPLRLARGGCNQSKLAKTAPHRARTVAGGQTMGGDRPTLPQPNISRSRSRFGGLG